jgi:hypothetical protein
MVALFPPAPLLRPPLSSIISPWLSAWSAIIHLLPQIFELVRAGRSTSVFVSDEVAEALAAPA